MGPSSDECWMLWADDIDGEDGGRVPEQPQAGHQSVLPQDISVSIGSTKARSSFAAAQGASSLYSFSSPCTCTSSVVHTFGSILYLFPPTGKSPMLAISSGSVPLHSSRRTAHDPELSTSGEEIVD